VFIRFYVYCAKLILKDMKDLPKHPQDFFKACYAYGVRIYDTVRAPSTAHTDTGGYSATDFWGHILWTVQAGNVKPVTTDEMKAGSPTRSIFMAPALIDLLRAKPAQQWYKCARHSGIHQGRSWANGGASDFYEKIADIKDVGNAVLWETKVNECEFPALRSLGFSNLLTIYPDQAAADLSCQNEYSTAYHEQERDIVANGATKRDINTALVGVLTGFAAAAATRPLVLFGNGVVFEAVNMNPSGDRGTWNKNEFKSVIIMEALKGVKIFQKDYTPPFLTYGTQTLKPELKLAEASGDDMALGFVLPPIVTANGKVGIAESWEGADARSAGQRVLDDFQRLYVGIFEKDGKPLARFETGAVLRKQGWIPKIFELCRAEAKTSTLAVNRILSEGEYLGHMLIATTEGHDPGSFDILGVRPMHKVLHTLIWPHHMHFRDSPITPAIHTALRAMACWLEAAVAYPPLRPICREVYQRAVVQAGSIAWDNDSIKQTLYDLLGVHFLSLEDDPAAILEDKGLEAGRFPSLETAWSLATGRDPPTNLSEESASKQLAEATDFDLSGFDDDDAVPDPARAPKPSSDPPEPDQSLAEEESEDDLDGLDD
jgi:hypothetical protein